MIVFFYRLQEYCGLILGNYIPLGTLILVIALSLFQGRTARPILWVSGAILAHQVLMHLLNTLVDPYNSNPGFWVMLTLILINIIASILIVAICAKGVIRQPVVHLKITLALLIMTLLLNLSRFIEELLAIENKYYFSYGILLDTVYILTLLSLIGSVISGFIKPNAQRKPLPEQGAVSQ